MQNVLVVGDVHGAWDVLCGMLGWHKPDLCICAGDFGWWPGYLSSPEEVIPKSVLKRTQIRFIDGNHENHRELRKIAPKGAREPVEVGPNIFYQPRGSRMTLEDGRTVFFAGGAKSVDAPSRTEGFDWFPEEILLREDLPEELPKADIVISHTTPKAFNIVKRMGRPPMGVRWDLTPDPSSAVLDEVLKACRPSIWIAAHFHRRFDGTHKGVEYHVLDMYNSVRPRSTAEFWLSGESKKGALDKRKNG